jgi:hypothetical protein
LCLASFFACAKPASGVKPEYENGDKAYTVGMWIGVPDMMYQYDPVTGNRIQDSGVVITEADFLNYYRDIANSGINLAFPGYGEKSGAYNIRALTAAKEVGIKQLIEDATLKTRLFEAYELIAEGIKTEAAIVAEVSAIIAPYLACESLAGFMIMDEPSVLLYDQLGCAQRIMAAAAPDKLFYVNLFPVIAGATQTKAQNYTEYINGYLDKVKTPYISYDHYPLKSSGLSGTALEDTFLYNMDIVKRAAGRDRDVWTFLQSIDYGASNRPLNSKADAGFQAYSFLAYGGKGIEWFCYWSPPTFDGATNFGTGMVGRDGVKSAAYDYVSAINKEILNFDHIYLDFEWQGVMINDVYGGEGNFEYIAENALTSHRSLKGITSADDVLIGVFKDSKDRDGFMAVNFTDPGKNTSNEVTLDISGYSNAIIIKNGNETTAAIKKGKLSFTMASGEGYFVIPY